MRSISARISETLKIKGKRHLGVYRAEIEDDERPHCEVSTGERNFCRKCGSALWLYDPTWPDLVHPFASAIDSELPKPPQRVHLMLKYKASWVEPDIRKGDKTFELYPEESIADWHKRECGWNDLRGSGSWTRSSSARAKVGAPARASASALRSAGFSSTDSPQPQAELWLGLRKVKPVRSVVFSKSISVPSRKSAASGATQTCAPFFSTWSSPVFGSVTRSTVYSMPAQPPFLMPRRTPMRVLARGDDLVDALYGRVGQRDDGEASHVVLQAMQVQGLLDDSSLRW